ncbi:MAG: DNA polymerase III subunit beta [Pseudomonadota bacterium]
MKLSVGRAALLKVLGQVSTVVEARNTTPILSNVVLSAGKDVLTVTGSDLDIQIVETVQADIAVQGATTVSSKTLFDVVRKLPADCQVMLELGGDGRISVIGGRARFALPTLPIEDFPLLAEVDLPVHFAMEVPLLKKAIDCTRFAMSTEETRYYLNGVYFHVDGEQMKFAATDGHRLARMAIILPDDAEDMPGIIVPRKAIGVVRKMLDDGGELVEIAVSATKIRFHLGTAVLTAKLIDGTFPDYVRVIPTGNEKLLRIDPKALQQGADRVAAIASEKTRSVKVSLDRDKVTLSVSSPENGTAAEEVPADYSGAPIEIGCNARYLNDILAQIEGDVVEMHVGDASGPVLVRASEESPAVFVIMPMRV